MAPQGNSRRTAKACPTSMKWADIVGSFGSIETARAAARASGAEATIGDPERTVVTCFGTVGVENDPTVVRAATANAVGQAPRLPMVMRAPRRAVPLVAVVQAAAVAL